MRNFCLHLQYRNISHSPADVCTGLTESKKMEHLIIHEILPPEMVEKILKLLHYKDIYQSQRVCRRWKEIIDLGNIVKKSQGKCLIIPFLY